MKIVDIFFMDRLLKCIIDRSFLPHGHGNARLSEENFFEKTGFLIENRNMQTLLIDFHR